MLKHIDILHTLCSQEQQAWKSSDETSIKSRFRWPCSWHQRLGFLTIQWLSLRDTVNTICQAISSRHNEDNDRGDNANVTKDALEIYLQVPLVWNPLDNVPDISLEQEHKKGGGMNNYFKQQDTFPITKNMMNTSALNRKNNLIITAHTLYLIWAIQNNMKGAILATWFSKWNSQIKDSAVLR